MKLKWMAAVGTLWGAGALFVGGALAQTATPGITPTVGATVTISATRTLTGTHTASTPQTTGTVVTGQPTVFPTVVVPAGIYVAGGQGNFPFANPAFERVWTRTDRPVAEQRVSRTWFWGPGPNTPGLLEAYKEDPLGRGQRLVQYFDKSRMELNNPNANASQPFFVTNGLLTVELISGFIQVGEKDFTQFRPACIPMSGDFGDTLAPTYFAFQKVSNTQAGDHPAANRTGQSVTETIDRNGTVGSDASKATVRGVQLVHFEGQTKHNIPAVFWDFLNSSGQVYNDRNQLATEQLIVPWFYASGLPISEPYWAKARIRGEVRDVLIQAFERRALTYVPSNQAGFQVEMANIGQHYFDWRYRNFGICAGAAPTTPTAPVPAPTGTVTRGGTTTPGTTTTPARTGTAVTTGTATVVTTLTPAATPSGVPTTLATTVR